MIHSGGMTRKDGVMGMTRKDGVMGMTRKDGVMGVLRHPTHVMGVFRQATHVWNAAERSCVMRSGGMTRKHDMKGRF